MLQDHGDLQDLFTVGSPAVIHTNPGESDEKRFPTIIRGWYMGNYVLLDRPITDETGSAFTKSQRGLVRFVSEGRACGFPCTLLKCGDQASPYLRVSWPRKIECVGIRKHERVEIRVPCKIEQEDQPEIEGETVDLSAGGCGIWSETRISPDTPVRISFSLPDASSVTGAKAVVRSSRPTGKGFFLGCMFDEEEPARTACDFFVTTTVERMRGGENRKRALLLESEDVRAESTRAKLEEKGYHVITVTCVVDAFFSLRMAFPNCFWIGAEQGELPALDICRILRQTNGFQTLPIYVIGANDTGLADELKQMDVVYVSSIDVMDRVLV
jgi:c-di-GMP-binding flagellar brake protein YcgR